MEKAKRAIIYTFLIAFVAIAVFPSYAYRKSAGEFSIRPSQNPPSYEIKNLTILIEVKGDNRATITLNYVIELKESVEVFEIMLSYTCTSVKAMNSSGPLEVLSSIDGGVTWISVQLNGVKGIYSFRVEAESPNLVHSFGTDCEVDSLNTLVKHVGYEGCLERTDFLVILPPGVVAKTTNPVAKIQALEDGRTLYSWSFENLTEEEYVPAIFAAELSYSNYGAVLRGIEIGIAVLFLSAVPLFLYSRVTGISWKFPVLIAWVVGIYRLLVTQLLFPLLSTAFKVSPYLGVWLFHILDPLLVLVGCAASPTAGFLASLSSLFTQHVPSLYYVPSSLPLEIGEHTILPLVAAFFYSYLPGAAYRKKGLRTFILLTYLSLLADTILEFAWAYAKISNYEMLYSLHYGIDIPFLMMVMPWELVSGTLYSATVSTIFISLYHFSPPEAKKPSISGFKSLLRNSFVPRNLLFVIPVFAVLVGAGIVFREKLGALITLAASVVPYLNMGFKAMEKLRDYLKVTKEIKEHIRELKKAKVDRRKELLEKLEEAFKQGRISKEVYEELKRKYSKE